MIFDLKDKSIFLKFGFWAFFLFFNLNICSAQIADTDISMNVYPNYPKPGDTVTISIASYATSLDKAYVSWLVNGTERARGIGKKDFSFEIDQETTNNEVTASIELVGGNTINKRVIINAVLVDMLWQTTNSYVPPFYRGKTLGLREGDFKVVAIPAVSGFNGLLNPNNLSYTWKKDGNGQTESSGFGKSSFSFHNSYLDPDNEIEVKVSDIGNTVNTGGKIIVRGLETPKILFYRKDPKLGVDFSESLTDGYNLSAVAKTIVAIPYYFSPKNLNSNLLNFEWMSGGEPINTGRAKNEASFVAPEGEHGGTDITVNVENTKTLFQTSKKKINVKF